jgi:hypothetical protein
VGQQVPHRDALPCRRGAGKVLVDGIVEPELAFIHEHHHRHCGELLAHGSRLEDGLRFHGYVEFHVGETVACRAHDLAVATDGQRHPGNLVTLHLALHEIVDSVGASGGRNPKQDDDRCKNCLHTPSYHNGTKKRRLCRQPRIRATAV